MHNFSTVIHIKKCDKIGICGKIGGNLHINSPSYPQVIPKLWITLCKPLSRHNFFTQKQKEKNVENKGKIGNKERAKKGKRKKI